MSKEYHKHILTLISGTVVGQLLPVLFMPVLAWMYAPVEFGTFALFVSITLVISVFACGRYEFAIILPASDEEAANLVALSNLIIIFLSLLSAVVLFFTFPMMIHYSDRFASISSMAELLPLAVLFVGIYQPSYYWANRFKNYKQLSISRVLQSVVFIIVSLLLGFTNVTREGLIIGYLIGQIAASLYLAFPMLVQFKQDRIKFEWSTIRKMAVKYKNFPLYLSWSAILEKVSGQLPIFLLGHYYSAAVVGYYALAQRAIQIPVILVARSVGDVFRQKANEHYRDEGNCVALFRTTFKQLTLLVVGPFLILLLFAPKIFGIVFTSEWQMAGVFAQLMSVTLLFQFVVSPLSTMFVVAERQKQDLLIQLYLIVAMSISIALGYYYYHSATISVLFFVITYAIKYTIECILSYYFSFGKSAVAAVRG